MRDKVKNVNGMALKLTSPGMIGIPDRLILLPEGKIYFIELKAPGKKLRPLQKKRKEQLENLGFKVFVLDSYEKVDMFLEEVLR